MVVGLVASPSRTGDPHALVRCPFIGRWRRPSSGLRTRSVRPSRS